MYRLDGQILELAWYQRISFFAVSLIVNAFGNALSVASAMGSAPWAAAAANLSFVSGWSIGWYLALFSVLSAVVNVLLIRQFNWRRVLGNIIFGLTFSYLVGLFTSLLVARSGIPEWPLAVRLLLDVVGIWLIGVSISVYQRVNWILHPFDDMTNILRFKYFKGNASAAQMTNFGLALAISLIVFISTHHVVALGFGTIISFLWQGKNIALSDRWVFPKLIHGNVTGESAR